MITFSNNNIGVSSLIAECNVIITPQIKGYPEKGLQRRKNISHTHTHTHRLPGSAVTCSYCQVTAAGYSFLFYKKRIKLIRCIQGQSKLKLNSVGHGLFDRQAASIFFSRRASYRRCPVVVLQLCNNDGLNCGNKKKF